MCGLHRLVYVLHTAKIWSISRGGPPPKGINKEYNKFFLSLSEQFRVRKLMFLAFPGGPGGFRELREAYRNHFHLSWYLLVPGTFKHMIASIVRLLNVMLFHIFAPGCLNCVFSTCKSDSSSKTEYISPWACIGNLHKLSASTFLYVYI